MNCEPDEETGGENFSVLGKDLWRVIESHCSSLSRRVLRMTAKSFAQLLKPRKRECGTLLSSLLVRSRSPSLLNWFCDDKLILSNYVYHYAGFNCNLPFLKYLWRRQKFHKIQIEAVCNCAAYYGHFKVLNWIYSLFELEPLLVKSIADGACSANRVDVLDWLEIRDADFTSIECGIIMFSATVRGNFEAMLWLWRRGARVEVNEACATTDNHEMLHWLVKNRFVDEQWVIENCTGHSYLPFSKRERAVLTTLEEFYEPNVNYSTKVFTNAVSLRSLRVLEWLHAHQFPWDEQTAKRAAEHGTPEMLKYCLENGCPARESELLPCAVHKTNRKVIEWLRSPEGGARDWGEPKVPWSSGQLSFYEFLLEMEYPRSHWDRILVYTERHYEGKWVQLGNWILAHVYV